MSLRKHTAIITSKGTAIKESSNQIKEIVFLFVFRSIPDYMKWAINTLGKEIDNEHVKLGSVESATAVEVMTHLLAVRTGEHKTTYVHEIL